MKIDSPITDALMQDPNRDGNDLLELCRKMETLTWSLRNSLKRIHDCEDAPAIDISGEAQFGLHCGVEDRGCANQYDGANYGYSQGVEKTLEWAVNEARGAFELSKEVMP